MNTLLNAPMDGPRDARGADPVHAGQRIVVAGFGNALRGDDGAGWRVARRLAERWCPDATPEGDDRSDIWSGVCILSGHQPLPEWVPAIAMADVAYFVDAEAGAACVRVRHLVTAERTEDPIAERPARGGGRLIDGHALGVEGLLVMARSLYGRAPDAYLITLPAASLGFDDRLSPQTQAAVDDVTVELERILSDGVGRAPWMREEAATCA